MTTKDFSGVRVQGEHDLLQRTRWNHQYIKDDRVLVVCAALQYSDRLRAEGDHSISYLDMAYAAMYALMDEGVLPLPPEQLKDENDISTVDEFSTSKK